MRVRVIGMPVGADSLRPGSVERRIRLVVGRRAAGISQVEVVLARFDPPTHGARQTSRHQLRCRVRARLADGELIVVEETGPTTDEALEAAMWRLEHRLDRPATRQSA